jgi:hypothetical protein
MTRLLLGSEPIVDPDRDESAKAQQKHEELAPCGRLIAGGWRLGLEIRDRSLLGRDLIFRIHGSTPSIALTRCQQHLNEWCVLDRDSGYRIQRWGIGKSLRLSVISTSAVAAMTTSGAERVQSCLPSVTIAVLLDTLEACLRLSAHLAHPFSRTIFQFGVILVPPNGFLGLKDFEQMPAFDLTASQVGEKRTPPSGANYFVDLAHEVLRQYNVCSSLKHRYPTPV